MIFVIDIRVPFRRRRNFVDNWITPWLNKGNYSIDTLEVIVRLHRYVGTNKTSTDNEINVFM